ncbi:hypothetical protein BKH45_04945 [Helicobacter sp. 11S03491-1]|nr:hypothetical protein BKH45_04945 [Helicobacter sp. 11S03491-1]
MIQEAVLRDIDKICEIENDSFLPQEGRFSRRVFLYHIHKGGKLFILKEKNKITGYILISFYFKSVRIYSLAILPQFQGKGFGKALCEYATCIASQKQKDFISLEVRLDNYQAIALYKRLGFIPTKILPKYYDNKDGIKMKKSLNVSQVKYNQ